MASTEVKLLCKLIKIWNENKIDSLWNGIHQRREGKGKMTATCMETCKDILCALSNIMSSCYFLEIS